MLFLISPEDVSIPLAGVAERKATGTGDGSCQPEHVTQNQSRRAVSNASGTVSLPNPITEMFLQHRGGCKVLDDEETGGPQSSHMKHSGCLRRRLVEVEMS